jgi:hypothetical protein
MRLFVFVSELEKACVCFFPSSTVCVFDNHFFASSRNGEASAGNALRRRSGGTLLFSVYYFVRECETGDAVVAAAHI